MSTHHTKQSIRVILDRENRDPSEQCYIQIVVVFKSYTQRLKEVQNKGYFQKTRHQQNKCHSILALKIKQAQLELVILDLISKYI